ncbi:hypothetical protein AJ80_08390 [Polytolypa hystricis UAMH7299]|uniref:Uncharacterized protein n=1 Tax=Polytolypa hystricis (strain UAMH7299) TaxID=1447883 RepID=A0A2B7X0L6_POLH7|nr:hypothetical protein AJ80_08390 [Polytolypa hystricis UAMH7299]
MGVLSGGNILNWLWIWRAHNHRNIVILLIGPPVHLTNNTGNDRGREQEPSMNAYAGTKHFMSTGSGTYNESSVSSSSPEYRIHREWSWHLEEFCNCAEKVVELRLKAAEATQELQDRLIDTICLRQQHFPTRELENPKMPELTLTFRHPNRRLRVSFNLPTASGALSPPGVQQRIPNDRLNRSAVRSICYDCDDGSFRQISESQFREIGEKRKWSRIDYSGPAIPRAAPRSLGTLRSLNFHIASLFIPWNSKDKSGGKSIRTHNPVGPFFSKG